MPKLKKQSKIEIKPYRYGSSAPSGHYLIVVVKTTNEFYFDYLGKKYKENGKNFPDNIDTFGKDKIKFGWGFGWSCEEDYSDVPKKQLEKAKRLAKKIVADKNVLKCTIYNRMLMRHL